MNTGADSIVNRTSRRPLWPLLPGVIVLAVAIGIYIAAQAPVAPEKPGRPKMEVAGRAEPPDSPSPAITATEPPAPRSDSVAPPADHSPSVERKKGARITIKAGQPIPELFPHQAERDKLLSLAASYDARHIPTIAASLRHPDATVRATARQALVQIGDPAAIPPLKEAAAQATDPEEAQALLESAEFLSLPRFMDVIMANNPGVTPSP